MQVGNVTTQVFAGAYPTPDTAAADQPLPLLEQLAALLQHARSTTIDVAGIRQLAVDILADVDNLSCTPDSTLLRRAATNLRCALPESDWNAPACQPDAEVDTTSADADARIEAEVKPKTGTKAPEVDETEERLVSAQEAADEIIAAWNTQNIPRKAQEHIVSLLYQGFDDMWAYVLVQNHAHSLDCLDAWFADSHDVCMHSWLNPGMNLGVARWLGQDGACLEKIRLLPAMIRSGLSVGQIDSTLTLDAFPDRLNIAFGRESSAGTHLVYGLLDVDTLHEWLRGRHEGLELIFEQAPKISPLRQAAGDFRLQLYVLINALEYARITMRGDTGPAKRCAKLMEDWRAAAAILDELLQPTMEADVTARPREVGQRLTKLSADFGPALRRLPPPPRSIRA